MRIFRTIAVSVLLCSWTTWTKGSEKKLDEFYTMILCVVLNEFWKQKPTKQQLYGYLPPIAQTFQLKRAKQARHW